MKLDQILIVFLILLNFFISHRNFFWQNHCRITQLIINLRCQTELNIKRIKNQVPIPHINNIITCFDSFHFQVKYFANAFSIYHGSQLQLIIRPTYVETYEFATSISQVYKGDIELFDTS